jgi:hypothetical protein
MTEDEAGQAIGELIHTARELVDQLSFDENGAMVGGKWMGGNGGLISRETTAKADALRRALSVLEETK